MRCPKCGFTSFPYLDNCGKCGQGLAEQRVALGVYALRPEPPDLRLAYQEPPTDGGEEAAFPHEAAGVELGSLDAISLDRDEVDEPLPALSSWPEEPEATADLLPPMALESAPAPEAHAIDPGTEQIPAQAPTPIFDLSELGEITLELEDLARPQDVSVDRPQPPTAAPPVYDLDLDSDANELALSREVDESEPIEASQDAIEYVLEVDDEIEVEFEVDELDIEENDETEPEEEDDDKR